MKKCVEILLIFVFAFMSFGGKELSEKHEPVYTKIHDEESEVYIWNELSKYSPNDQITAGIMGYFWKESRMKSNAVAGWDVRNRWKGQEIDICLYNNAISSSSSAFVSAE